MKKEYLDKDITVFQFLKKRFLINEVDKKWLIISDKIYFLLKKYAKDKFYEKELINKINKEEFEILKNKGFFNRLNLENSKFLFIVHCTNDCNMECEYCYIKKEKERTGIDRKVSLKIIKLVEEKIRDKRINEITINFHGGEPMLFFSKILFIIKEVEKLKKNNENKKIFYRIQTNGTILNEKIIEKIKEYNIYMSVSLDGNKIDNDKKRKFINRTSAFSVIKKNISKLKKNKINFQIIATIDENVNFLEKINIFKKLRINNIKFSFLNDERMKIRYSLINQKKMLRSFLEMMEWLIEYNLKNKNKIKILNIEEIIRLLLFQKKEFLCIPGECKAGEKILSISHNGEIKKCDNYYILKNNNIEDIKNVLPLKCKKCIFLFLCNGGCPVERKFSGSKEDIMCYFKKGIYKHLLLKLIKEKYKELISLI